MEEAYVGYRGGFGETMVKEAQKTDLKCKESKMKLCEVFIPFNIVEIVKNAFKSNHKELITWKTIKNIG